VKWGGRLPRVVLLHGTADRCALVGNAQQFAEALRDAGAQVRTLATALQKRIVIPDGSVSCGLALLSSA